MTTEEKALLLDRTSIIRVISALRKYRAAVKELLEKRYQDGACDGVAVSQLESQVEEAEEDLQP